MVSKMASGGSTKPGERVWERGNCVSKSFFLSRIWTLLVRNVYIPCQVKTKININLMHGNGQQRWGLYIYLNKMPDTPDTLV